MVLVLVLMEIFSSVTSHDENTESLVINVECFNIDDPDILLNLLKFKFGSGKSLTEFLEIHQNDILEGLPNDDPALLILEEQHFLSSPELKLSPEDIFKLAVQHYIITLKHVRNYILEARYEYIYQLTKAPLNGTSNTNVTQNIQ